MNTRFLIAFSLLFVVAACVAEPIDLIQGLNSGQLWAEFRGAGDRAVTGTIGRTGEQPLDVNIPAGTQFWAQGGGRQGQSGFGNRTIGLRDVKVAQVTLHTACTNLGLPEATADDIMIPVAPHDGRLAQLMGLPGIEQQPHMAVQVAVWAITNNARGYDVRRMLRKEPGVGSSEYATQMLTLAADLMRQAGLDPQTFRLFR